MQLATASASTVSGSPSIISEALVQILFGETKTHAAFEAVDVVKLGTLADAVPCDLADAFVMFAKTGAFTEDEIRLAQTLNDHRRRRVILWSREELEPCDVYERSEARLGERQYATTLTDTASITDLLWFQPVALLPPGTSEPSAFASRGSLMGGIGRRCCERKRTTAEGREPSSEQGSKRQIYTISQKTANPAYAISMSIIPRCDTKGSREAPPI